MSRHDRLSLGPFGRMAALAGASVVARTLFRAAARPAVAGPAPTKRPPPPPLPARPPAPSTSPAGRRGRGDDELVVVFEDEPDPIPVLLPFLEGDERPAASDVLAAEQAAREREGQEGEAEEQEEEDELARPDHEARLRGHEGETTSARGVLLFAGALLVGAVVLHLLLWGLASLHDREDQAPREPAWSEPGPAPGQEPAAGAPWLHWVDPPKDGDLVLEAARARLRGYAWVDRERGVVRIPIERAMELVAQTDDPRRLLGGGDAEPRGPAGEGPGGSAAPRAPGGP